MYRRDRRNKCSSGQALESLNHRPTPPFHVWRFPDSSCEALAPGGPGVDGPGAAGTRT